MRLRTLLALALMAALGAVAAVAVAAPPPGKGKPDRPAAAKAEAKAAKAEAKAAKAKTKAAKLKAKRLARLQAKEESEVLENCRPRVSYLLKGEFVSASEGSLVLLVKKSNKHARAFVGKQATVVIGERTRVRGGRKLADAQAGDKVVVHLRGCKDEAEGSELYAKKVVVTPTKAGGEDEEEETGSTSTETSTTESTTTESTESTTTESTESTTTSTTP